MVFGWLTSLAMDTVSHVAGEGSIKYGEKEFDRFMMSYEFAMEAQKLKREDVRDLVELIVSRMEMYHLVGALLLQFCVDFYAEMKLLEEEYKEEPDFVLEIFLISNICAIGYLLFAVWLSLHASVAAHALGVEFLLESSRLTIPSPENLRQMRQNTSIFRHVHALFADASRPPVPGQQLALQNNPAFSPSASSTGAAPSTRALATKKFVTEEDFDLQDAELTRIQGQGVPLENAGPGKLPLSLDKDMNTMEHRHRFAESHRSWLRFDAYSRVCMAMGINQMLQALSYFIIGPVQQKRPSSALISLFSIQVIALLLLKLDLRNTEAEPDEPDDPEDSDDSRGSFMAVGSKDISVASWRDLVLTLSTFSLAPLWTTLALWAHRFTTQKHLLSISVTPCFFLHAMWLYLVLKTVSPNEGELLPTRLRTVGYLDIFTKDILAPTDWDEFLKGGTAVGKKRSRESPSAPVPTLSRRLGQGDGTSRPSPSEKASHMYSKSGESVPWLVVRRFTKAMILMWVLGGFAHFVHTIDESWEVYQRDENEEGEKTGEPRRLAAVWPEPARFFEVTSLHCNASHVSFASPLALYSASRQDGEAAVGPLAPSGGPDAHAVMCREEGGCHALAPRQGAWHLEPVTGDTVSQVALPHDWRMATGEWVTCSPAPCEAARLAGWDGAKVIVADLRRDDPDSPWSLKQRFGIHEGSDRRARDEEAAEKADVCNETSAVSYSSVLAMQLSVRGPCQTLTVLLGNGTLDGWNLDTGVRLGTWQIGSALHTTMCHDGKDLFLTHPGDRGGPVLETLPLPGALASCGRDRERLASNASLGIALTKEALLRQGQAYRFSDV